MDSLEITVTVQADLHRLAARVEHTQSNAEPLLPPRLFYVTDGLGAQAFISTGTLEAQSSRFGRCAGVARYGVDFALAYIEKRLASATSPDAIAFYESLLAHFNPVGGAFDSFIVRLSETCAPMPRLGNTTAAYAFGLVTDIMSIRTRGEAPANLLVQPAIYSPDEQKARLGAYCDAYETYFLGAVERFGREQRQQYLPSCREYLRSLIGQIVYRFRPPSDAAEREWVGMALDRRPADEQCNDGILFRIVDEVFAPYVRIDPRQSQETTAEWPVERVVIGQTLPYADAKDSLRAYLSAHRRRFSIRIDAEPIVDKA